MPASEKYYGSCVATDWKTVDLQPELDKLNLINYKACVVCNKVKRAYPEWEGKSLVCSEGCANVIEINPLPYDKFLDSLFHVWKPSILKIDLQNLKLSLSKIDKIDYTNQYQIITSTHTIGLNKECLTSNNLSLRSLTGPIKFTGQESVLKASSLT